MSLYDRLAKYASASIDYNKLMEKNPTYLGMKDGVSFYEHPTKGDEVPMIAVHGETRRACQTDCWEMDALDDYD